MNIRSIDRCYCVIDSNCETSPSSHLAMIALLPTNHRSLPFVLMAFACGRLRIARLLASTILAVGNRDTADPAPPQLKPTISRGPAPFEFCEQKLQKG